eukprot:Hpha_TRINITY_DN12129_c0_g1::TRINITY_DN12129_c0_g1_i2::g.81995::m.81995
MVRGQAQSNSATGVCTARLIDALHTPKVTLRTDDNVVEALAELLGALRLPTLEEQSALLPPLLDLTRQTLETAGRSSSAALLSVWVRLATRTERRRVQDLEAAASRVLQAYVQTRVRFATTGVETEVEQLGGPETEITRFSDLATAFPQAATDAIAREERSILSVWEGRLPCSASAIAALLRIKAASLPGAVAAGAPRPPSGALRILEQSLDRRLQPSGWIPAVAAGAGLEVVISAALSYLLALHDTAPHRNWTVAAAEEAEEERNADRVAEDTAPPIVATGSHAYLCPLVPPPATPPPRQSIGASDMRLLLRLVSRTLAECRGDVVRDAVNLVFALATGSRTLTYFAEAHEWVRACGAEHWLQPLPDAMKTRSLWMTAVTVVALQENTETTIQQRFAAFAQPLLPRGVSALQSGELAVEAWLRDIRGALAACVDVPRYDSFIAWFFGQDPDGWKVDANTPWLPCNVLRTVFRSLPGSRAAVIGCRLLAEILHQHPETPLHCAALRGRISFEAGNTIPYALARWGFAAVVMLLTPNGPKEEVQVVRAIGLGALLVERVLAVCNVPVMVLYGDSMPISALEALLSAARIADGSVQAYPKTVLRVTRCIASLCRHSPWFVPALPPVTISYLMMKVARAVEPDSGLSDTFSTVPHGAAAAESLGNLCLGFKGMSGNTRPETVRKWYAEFCKSPQLGAILVGLLRHFRGKAYEVSDKVLSALTALLTATTFQVSSQAVACFPERQALPDAVLSLQRALHAAHRDASNIGEYVVFSQAIPPAIESFRRAVALFA